jgi:predicted esterase
MPWRAGQAPAPGNEPVLDSIDPIDREVGPTADVVLHCHGSGFTADSFIMFAGIDERTDYVSATELTTIITGSMFTSPHVVNVHVYKPGAGASDPQSFTFYEP